MRAKKVVISDYVKRCQFICRNCSSSPHALSGGEGCAVHYFQGTSREVISEGVTVYTVVLGVGYDEVGYEGFYCMRVDNCYFVPSSQP